MAGEGGNLYGEGCWIGGNNAGVGDVNSKGLPPAAPSAPPQPVLERPISRGYARALLDSPKLLANLCRKYFTKYDANNNNLLDLSELVALTQDLRSSLGIALDVDAEANVRKSMSEFSACQGDSLNSFEFVLWFAEELKMDLECCIDHLPSKNTSLEPQLERLPSGALRQLESRTSLTAPIDLVATHAAAETPSAFVSEVQNVQPRAIPDPAATDTRPGQSVHSSTADEDSALNENICVDVFAISGTPIVSKLQFTRGDLVASVLQAAVTVCGEAAWNNGALVAKLLLEGEARRPHENLLSWPERASVTLVWLPPEVFVGPTGAVTTGDIEEVKNLLALGVPVDWRDGARLRTGLMWAAAAGNTEMVEVLLAHGADTSARTMGATAEGIALANDHKAIAKIIKFAAPYRAENQIAA